jgi:hypothetical protein
MRKHSLKILLSFLIKTLSPLQSFAWHKETPVAIAKVPGYSKWFNA